MEKKKVRIVADERERKSGIPDELARLNALVDFKQLDVGDYLVAPDCAVERKSVRDLMNSIYDRRLFVQCSELTTQYTKPILIVEGPADFVEKLTDNPMVFYGALVSIALDFRMAIIHTASKKATARVLFTIANRALKNNKIGPLLRKIKKGSPINVQQLSILASLPGVGDRLAVKLLKKFKTPIKALNASTAELARIEGMGYARAVKLRKVLDTIQFDKKMESQTALDGYDSDTNNI
ncbi:MAG: ERCC4 domain-containing protein [Nitrososphaerales archaeon]